MASTTTTPQQVLKDRKVDSMLNDLMEASVNSADIADDLGKNAMLRSASSIKSQLKTASKDLYDCLEDSEYERAEGLKGKLKDLRKLNTYVQTQIDALGECDLLSEQVQAVVDAGVDVLIADLLGAYALIAGSGSELKRLQVELAMIKKKLDAANRLARDTKIKAAIGAALVGATMALGPVSAPVGVLIFAGNIALDQVLDSALAGREDTTLKTAWDYADKVGGAADAFDKLPTHLGPVMDLVNIGIDIGECFASESEKNALIAQISAFAKDVEKARAKFRADADKVKKMSADARRELAAAIAEVGRCTIPRYPFAGVVRWF